MCDCPRLREGPGKGQGRVLHYREVRLAAIEVAEELISGHLAPSRAISGNLALEVAEELSDGRVEPDRHHRAAAVLEHRP